MPQPAALFPESPTLTLYDPLGAFLGAGDGHYHYTFDDAAKLAGHACPTVAGAFVMATRALKLLFKEDVPVRGDVEITVHGAQDKGSLGPFSQILTLLTGAAAANGFGGLRGQHHIRRGLLAFNEAAASEEPTCTFRRVSTDASVTLAYDLSAFPRDPKMVADLMAQLSGEATDEVSARFRAAWRARVVAILADGGQTTIHEVE